MLSQKKLLAAVVLLQLIFSSGALANAQVSFAAAQNYPLNAAPFQAVIGDFNGDGKPDLAVLSIFGGIVSTLLNNGGGTFASPRDFPAITPDPGGPNFFSGVALGDVNGDRKLDVIVSHGIDSTSGTGVINVLLGNGDGTLQPPITTTVDHFPFAMYGVWDFNGDGKLDVLCVAHDPTETARSLVLFLGNGDGSFTLASASQPGDSHTAVVADMNHDGKLDVIMPTRYNAVAVFFGNGDGSFQPSFQSGAPAPTFTLSAGDFDNDGKPDLVTTSPQQYVCTTEPPHCAPTVPGSAAVLLGKGDGTFGGPGIIASADYGFSAVGDFDGDGNLDFAAGSAGTLDFYLGNGKGGGSAPSSVSFAVGVTHNATADLDGDGFTDMVLLDPSPTVKVALNTTPTFSLGASAPGSPIHAGGIATYAITVGQQHEYNGTVALTCSAPPSAGIRCSLSPSSVVPGSSSTLTVTTTAASAGLAWPVSPSHSKLLYALWLPLGAFVFSGIGFGSRQSRRKKLFVVLVLGCALSASLIFQVACGGGGSAVSRNSGTSPGTYAITVRGTSGSTQRSTAVTLTVQ